MTNILLGLLMIQIALCTGAIINAIDNKNK